MLSIIPHQCTQLALRCEHPRCCKEAAACAALSRSEAAPGGGLGRWDGGRHDGSFSKLTGSNKILVFLKDKLRQMVDFPLPS